MWTRPHVPHDGDGTHALVVAVSVTDDELYDPAARARVLARVQARAAEALDALDIRPDLYDPFTEEDHRARHDDPDTAGPPVDGRGETTAA